jgi:hypothetical protein
MALGSFSTRRRHADIPGLIFPAVSVKWCPTKGGKVK